MCALFLVSYFVRAGRSRASAGLLCMLVVCGDCQSDSMKVHRRCGKSATFSLPLTVLSAVQYVVGLAAREINKGRRQKVVYRVLSSAQSINIKYCKFRISQEPSLGGRATAHIIIARCSYILLCVMYVSWMHPHAARKSWIIFTFMLCTFRERGGRPQRTFASNK